MKNKNRSLQILVSKEATQLFRYMIFAKNHSDIPYTFLFENTQLCYLIYSFLTQPLLNRNKLIASGHEHTIALLHDGSLKMYGNPRPTQLMWNVIPNKISVKDIATGMNHCIFTSESGLTYTIGCNDSGQLGHGDQDFRSKPTLVVLLETMIVTQVYANRGISFALTKQGKVYSWGSGNYGALGYSIEKDNYYQHSQLYPRQVTTLDSETIVDLASSQYSTFFITRQGRVYMSGSSLSFRSGINLQHYKLPSHRIPPNYIRYNNQEYNDRGERYHFLIPCLIQTLAKYVITKIYATTHATLFQTNNNKYLICGKQADNVYFQTPQQLISYFPIDQIASSYNNFLFLSRNSIYISNNDWFRNQRTYRKLDIEHLLQPNEIILQIFGGVITLTIFTNIRIIQYHLQERYYSILEEYNSFNPMFGNIK